MALLLAVALISQLSPLVLAGEAAGFASSGDGASSFVEPLNVCEEGEFYAGSVVAKFWLPEAVFRMVRYAGGVALSAPLSVSLSEGHPPEVFKPPRAASPLEDYC